MKDPAEDASYVQKVSQDTSRYLRDLLADNERVRSVVASLEVELATARRDVEEARAALKRRSEDEARLKRQLACVETEGSRLAERYLEVEEKNANLANLYVASYRLHGTLERADVLEAIQEIVANLVGSEQLAIYSMHAGGTMLERVISFGLSPEPPRAIEVGRGLIGAAARDGRTCLYDAAERRERLAHERDLTACVALTLDGAVTGVLAIFRLLPQKTAFGPLDRELFDMLGTHAATALFCTDRTALSMPRGSASR